MAETILMIHGMWGGPWYWQNYIEFLEEKGHRCRAVTLRHHDADPGDEPNPGLGATSLLDYAEDLEKEIRALDEIPVIMGHSMGGLLAQILGARGLGKALVLLTPASPRGIMALTPSVIKSFWSTLTRWGFWAKPNRPTLEEAVYSMLHLVPPDRQREYHDRFVYESGRAAFEIGFWLMDARRAAEVDRSRVTCPVLVVSGEEDRITPASVNKKVAERYAAVSTYTSFPHHAHWVIMEPGWEDIVAHVADWLEKNLNK